LRSASWVPAPEVDADYQRHCVGDLVSTITLEK
jgi:hypothetical protein